MDACGTITKNQAVNCQTRPVAGNDPYFLIANYDDIASFTPDPGSNLKITGITMKTGKKFFKYEGLKKSHKIKAAQVTLPYFNAWDHTGEFYIFDNSADTKEEVANGLCQGRFVVIAANKWKGAANAFKYEVYGLEVGLVTKDGTERDANNADSQGAWKIVVGPQEDEHESLPARSFYVNDDPDDTEDAIEALLVAAP